MQHGQTYTDAVPMPMPFTAPIVSAHEDLMKLAEHVEMVANRLCGAVPTEEKAAGNKLASVPSGVFEEIVDRGRDMLVKIDRIRVAIQRIERELP